MESVKNFIQLLHGNWKYFIKEKLKLIVCICDSVCLSISIVANERIT